MKTHRFIMLFGLTSILLAACASVRANPTASSTKGGPTKVTLPDGSAPVLTWQRSGGIAGFCDVVSIAASGAYTVENCSGKPKTRNAQLDEAQLIKLTEWLKTFQSFSNGDEDTGTPAYPDQMYVKTNFVGNGTTPASIDQMVEISNFVAGLAVREPAKPEAASKASQFLADTLKISVDEVSFVSFEAVEWPDACMGVVQPDVMCAQVITPGYIIMLEAQGRSYELHTSIDAANMQIVK